MARSAFSRLLIVVASALVCLAFFARAKPGAAADRPTLAGAWNATPLAERWNIGDWGKACGPRPAPHETPGGQVTIHEEGVELAMSGAGRAFRTDECWEQIPSGTRASHTVSARSWQTKCTSAPNDPRQTTLVTTIAATDNTISFDETGQYQFRIEGQNCTASVRRSRNLVLAQRQGEAPRAVGPGTPSAVQPQPTAIAAPSPAPTPLPLPAGQIPPARPNAAERCAQPGAAARLEVRPARKLLRPGERFAFRALAADANGCPVEARLTWAFTNTNTKLTVTPGGTVAAPEDADDGIDELTVTFVGKTVRVTVEVARPERYEALLSTESVNDAGESEEAATTVVEGANLAANPAVAEDKGRSRKTTFIIVIAALALGLAALGLVLLKRSSPRRSPARPIDEPEPEPEPEPLAAPGEPPPKIILTHGRAVPARPLLCPSCRAEFSPESTFCPHDGNRLVAAPLVSFHGPSTAGAGGICPTCGRGYDPGVKTCPEHGDDLVPTAVYRATVQKVGLAGERGKICPSCGGRYGGEATFCGKDGTALVLVN